jgi:hypothetical protein
MFKLQHFIRASAKKVWKDTLVILLFSALTLILLYPFSLFKMDTQLIGSDVGDSYQNLWNLWWVKHSMLSMSNPFATNLLFYPNGADLYVHSLSPAAGFFTIPFQQAFGLVFSYNLIVLLSFVLGGYGAYRLALHITRDWRASFFAGLVFAFSSYHFARAIAHMNLVSVQWLPFYVLFLLKMRDEPSLKNTFLAVTFLSLTAFAADLQYVLFLGIFTLFYLLYELALNREQIRKFLLRVGLMTVTFAGVLFLFLPPLMIGFFTGKYAYAAAAPSDSVTLSSDLLAFFTPSSGNLFFGKYVESIIGGFSSVKLWPIEVTYIGYTCLALAVFAAVKVWKTARFWLLSALAFMVLSLGPVLHVLGVSVFTPFQVNVPLPELVLYYVFPIFRAPSRFIVVAMLCLAVLAAMSLKYANSWIARQKRGKILGLLFFAVLCVSLLAESNMSPYPVVEDTSIPQFYYQLSRMNETFAVLDLPQTYAANNLYMYYGTASEKPLLGGSISRVPMESLRPLLAVPIVAQAGYLMTGGKLMEPTDIVLQDLNFTNLYTLQLYNVRYVILHKDLLDNATLGNLTAYMNSMFGSPVYSDAKIVSFETKPPAQPGFVALVGDGWRDLESRDGAPTRWMSSNATINLVSPAPRYYTLNFTVGTENANKTLSVSVNGRLLAELPVSKAEHFRYLMSIFLHEGENELTFSCDQAFVPAEGAANSLDNKLMTVFVQNVDLLPA